MKKLIVLKNEKGEENLSQKELAYTRLERHFRVNEIEDIVPTYVRTLMAIFEADPEGLFNEE